MSDLGREIRQLVGDDHADLVRRIEDLERVATARSVYASTNQRFPRWSPDRWMQIFMFLFVVIGGIWFAGGEWRNLKDRMTGLERAVTSSPSPVAGANLRSMQRTHDELLAQQAAAVAMLDSLSETVDRQRINLANQLADLRRRMSAIEEKIGRDVRAGLPDGMGGPP